MEQLDELRQRINNSNLDDRTKARACEGLERIFKTGEADFAPYYEFSGLFLWKDTAEGVGFWSNVRKAIEDDVRRNKKT